MSVMNTNKPSQRIALIAGATGLVGGHCLRALLENELYGKVIALTRQPLLIKHPKLDCRVVDFNDLLAASGELQCDDVFCCLGTTIKQAGSRENFRKVDFDYCMDLAKLGIKSGAGHFLLISAIGASAKSPVFYSRVKGELEQAIEALGFARYSVFQPSFLAGERKETRRAEAIGIEWALKLSSLLVGPFADYSVIKAEALAAAMVATALMDTESQVSGTRRLKYRKIMQLKESLPHSS